MIVDVLRARHVARRLGKFDVMAADCPWSFSDKLPGDTRGAEKQYQVLSLEDIRDRRNWTFEFPPLADDAVLFLWRVSAMVEEAYQVVRAWGFVPKSEVVWRKLTKEGKPWIGMGRYTRASHETCIIAARGRGSQLVGDHSIRSVFEAQVPVGADGKYIHSAKPASFYTDVVEKMIPCGRRVELFARTLRPGWTCLGNEISKESQT